MSLLAVFFIAAGLAMDAFAASVSSGLTIRRMRLRHAVWISSAFGGFQAAMPLLGWMIGHGTKDIVSAWDHWVAFGLLLAVGGKDLWESAKSEQQKRRLDPTSLHVLLLLALATSIDAFAVGLSLSFLDVSIWTTVAIIGAVTFATSFAGVYIGDVFGHLFERQVEALGGLILIGIGVKILVEHLL
jgi:putative Mn2+ efflux pump MntP